MEKEVVMYVVRGPTGPTGPTGESIVGPTGPPSTVPGPTGPTGPAGSNIEMPIGSIIMYYSETPPPGWGLCDGTVYSTPIGNIQSPDLRGRFAVGLDLGSPSVPIDAPVGVVNYGALNNRGGEPSNVLSEPQLAAHTHDITVEPAGSHSHDLLQVTRHIDITRVEILNPLFPTFGLARGEVDGSITFEIPPGTDSPTLTAGNHVHDAVASTVGESAPIENRPPYTVVNYIIKIA
jgi:microcystin-dependent protein